MTSPRQTAVIADAGATKTNWFTPDGTPLAHCGGINPVTMTDEAILAELRAAAPEIASSRPTHIYYYGAGCRPNQIERMHRLLSVVLGEIKIEVASDMLGAARGMLGRNHGIACILGTGSNACLCSDGNIVDTAPSLGYILGDEGSGACIGRMIVNAAFKGALDADLTREFTARHSLDEVINRVYSSPSPNRWLASLVPWVAGHIDRTCISNIISRAFNEFLEHNVTSRDWKIDCRTPIAFTGGVAGVFSRLLQQAVARHGLSSPLIVSNPAQGLAHYHSLIS